MLVRACVSVAHQTTALTWKRLRQEELETLEGVVDIQECKECVASAGCCCRRILVAAAVVLLLLLLLLLVLLNCC